MERFIFVEGFSCVEGLILMERAFRSKRSAKLLFYELESKLLAGTRLARRAQQSVQVAYSAMEPRRESVETSQMVSSMRSVICWRRPYDHYYEERSSSTGELLQGAIPCLRIRTYCRERSLASNELDVSLMTFSFCAL